MPRQAIEVFPSSDKRLIIAFLTNALAWLTVFGIYTDKMANLSRPQLCGPTATCDADRSCMDRKSDFYADFTWSLAGGIIFESTLALLGVMLRLKQYCFGPKTEQTIASDFMQAPKLHTFLLVWVASFTALSGVGFKRLYDLATAEGLFCYPSCKNCYDEMDFEAEGAIEQALLPLAFGITFAAMGLIALNLKIILNALGVGYAPTLLQEFMGTCLSVCIPNPCLPQHASYTPIQNQDDNANEHCCCYIPAPQQIM